MVQNAAGVTLPGTIGSTWIPNPPQLFETKVALLQAVGGVIDAYAAIAEDYPRRILAHGDLPQVMPGLGQVLVSLLGVFPGRAGEQLFVFQSGSPGRQDQRFARYRVLVGREWESLEADAYAPGLPGAETMAKQSQAVDTAGWVIYAGLLAFAQGGLTTSIPSAPVKQDNLLVASMVPYGPEGGVAGWIYVVEQQL